MHYTCITCITIDSVMRMEKKNYPQVYLEECKYKIKKIKMPKFVNTELESELESNTELESKLKLQSRTKYLEQNGVIQHNWTGTKKIWFLHVF